MRSVPLCVSCPSPVRLLASSGGGGGGGPSPPVPGSGLCASLWAGLCVRGGPAPVGGGVCVPPSLRGVAGGPRGAGGRSASVRVIGVAQSIEGVVSTLFRFVSAC